MFSEELIKYILTLRYDPRDSIHHKSNLDITPTESDPEGFETQKLLEAEISKLEKYDNIALTLSSGVDSTTLLALIKKQLPKKKIHCISLAFHGTYPEFLVSRYVAARYNCEMTNLQAFSILHNMPELIKYTDDPARWNTYGFVCAKYAKSQNFDCLITGDGADEIFCGYVWRYNQANYFDTIQNDFVPDQDKLLKNFDWEDIYDYVRQDGNPILQDFNGKLLHDYIPTTQTISRKTGIPIISPYLSDDIVNYGLHLPRSEKFNGELGKITLRKISERIGLKQQDKKIAFSPNLPTEFLDFRDQLKIKKLLVNKHAKILKYVNHDWIKKHINDWKDRRYANKLAQLYALELKLNEN